MNWIAGDEGSFRIGPLPQTGQGSGFGSVNFWILSKRFLHASHSNSYKGMLVIDRHSSIDPLFSPSIRFRWSQIGTVPLPSR
ncbi:MAG TPA: hypothetical protein VNC21_03525, partial [Vicinamibacterales bacterium]|nr:hypothetical protein [Vicinamibacterales bacterium]